MPERTQIDYSHLSIDDLFRELKGLRDDLKEAQLRVEQVLYDFQ